MRATSYVALAALGSLCSGTVSAGQTGGALPANHGTHPTPRAGGVTALLTDPLGSRAASGTATVTGTLIRITWAGDQPGSRRAWSVRRGSCGRDEGMVGVVGSYALISVNAAGAGSAEATLSAPLPASAAFHVAVEESGNDGSGSTLIACGSLWDGTSMRPAAKAMDHSGMSMPGMKAPASPAMDHATMDHSSMSMPGMKAPASPAMDPATMDHSKMGMSEGGDSTSRALMAIQRRMMADPVIRERVRTDPVLRRMMDEMPMSDTSSMGMSMPGMTSAPRPGAPRAAGRAARTPATKSTAKPAAGRPSTPRKAATKPAPPPATKPAPMPGMDHSKMPGMRKPPV